MTHAVIFPPTVAGDAESYALDLVLRYGQALLKGRRSDVAMLENGRARLTIEYSTLADLVMALGYADTFRAIASIDAGPAQLDLDRLSAS